MRSLSCVVVLSGLFGLPVGVAAQDLAACGDIRIEAEAECEFVAPSVQCEVACTPVSVEAACAAELYVGCEGMCNFELEATCKASCEADCAGGCEVDPGTFDCRGACQADCGGACEAECAASTGNASCMASCEATCSAGCEGECTGVPPSAACDVKCEAGCQGSCEAQANASCQAECQASGFATCQARVEGGCEAACSGEQGALFCDGHYVDPRDDIASCVAALEAALNIEVVGYAEASGECAMGRCSGKASAGLSCDVNRPGRPTGVPSTLVWAIGALGFFLFRRRTA